MATGQSFTIRNDGTGAFETSDDRFLFVGAASEGTNYKLVTITSPAAAVDQFGQGPLVEDLCYHLAHAGGPVYAMKTEASTAAVAGSVTASLVGTATGTITVANAPYDAYDVIVEITVSGTLGAGEFRYTLDGGRGYSPSIVIPAGGVYNIPNTNIELTFVPGAGADFYDEGDTHSFTCTGPLLTSSDLSAAVTALLALDEEFDVLAVCGMDDTAADAATMFSALSTQLATLENDERFVGGVIDAASMDSASTVKTSFTSITSDRVAAVYGRGRRTTAKPFTGWAKPLYNGVAVFTARAAQLGLSGDLKRVDSGPLDEFTELTHNERTASTSLDGTRLTTFKTWRGRQGVYFEQARIKSANGSDFRLWPHRRVMDRACRTVKNEQQGFIGRNPRVNADASIAAGLPGAPGTLFAPDAVSYEKEVDTSLREQLTKPTNADGTPGHVSGLRYDIDRTYNVKTNSKVRSEIRIVSLAYIDFVESELSYTLTL